MILTNGEIFDSSMQDEILDGLEEVIGRVRMAEPVKQEVIIDALDHISARIASGQFDALISQIGLDNAEMYKEQAVQMLRKESLEYRLNHELPLGLDLEYVTNPPGVLPEEIYSQSPDGTTGEISSHTGADVKKIAYRRVPLGTIMHIAAGNADVLPAYSLIEGLLCGNVNILKLPEADDGLTVMLLKLLVDEAPELSGYIHVFDTPSSDITAMMKMAKMSDAISVWGGDAAISSVRNLASCGTQLIEWGHKLSFCYISGDPLSYPDELRALANHIMETKQLLCSSCQVIYLNTESMQEAEKFCEAFLPILDQAASEHVSTDIGAAAEQTLRRRCDEIEHILQRLEPDAAESRRIRYDGTGCSLLLCPDRELEISELWGNCLVKCLPEANIYETLRAQKGYLQTAGLIAGEDRRRLTEIFIKSGINRILRPGDMSAAFPGESHDGMYPFERYTRIVNYQL